MSSSVVVCVSGNKVLGVLANWNLAKEAWCVEYAERKVSFFGDDNGMSVYVDDVLTGRIQECVVMKELPVFQN